MKTEPTWVDKVKWLQRAMLTSAASAVHYNSWTDTFCRDDLKRQVLRCQAVVCDPDLDDSVYMDDESYRSHVDRSKLLEFPGDEVTSDQLKDLGFRVWSDEPGDLDPEGRVLWLVPLWLRPLLRDGLKVESILGTEYVLSEDTDCDHRGGCTAWGFRRLP